MRITQRHELNMAAGVFPASMIKADAAAASPASLSLTRSALYPLKPLHRVRLGSRLSSKTSSQSSRQALRSSRSPNDSHFVEHPHT